MDYFTSKVNKHNITSYFVIKNIIIHWHCSVMVQWQWSTRRLYWDWYESVAVSGMARHSSSTHACPSPQIRECMTSNASFLLVYIVINLKKTQSQACRHISPSNHSGKSRNISHLLTTRTSTCSQFTVRNQSSSEGKLSPMSLDAMA